MKSLRTTLLLASAAAFAALSFPLLAQTPPAVAAPAAVQPAKPPMQSTVIDTDKITPETIAGGSRRSVFNGPTTTLNNFECHITTINPGEAAHPPHTHGNEEMLIVKEGTLEIFINGKTQVAGPDSIIFYAPNDLHGTRNIGTTPVTYFVFAWITDKTPKAIPPPGNAPASVMAAAAAFVTSPLPGATTPATK
jgi:XRE family transcriptional regulator, regulator of sulfur utilization